jgi:peptidyl-prolyl cis-trans isomerase D
MLMQMRKGAGSWVAKIFLAIITLSFVAWGVGDIFRGDSATTVADVGSAQISYNQLARAYSNQTRSMAQSGITVDAGSELAHAIVELTLNDLIDQALYDQEADSFGITIGKETVAEAIATNPAFQDQSGQFNPQIFPIALANAGMSEEQYVASLARQLTSAQLVDSFVAAPPLPSTLINKLFAFRNETRTAEIVVVPNDLLASVTEPTEAELNTFFEDHAADYRAPEYRSAAYVTVYPEDLAEDMAIPEEDLLEAYDDTAGRWVTPERRTLQQIPFETENQALTAYDRLVNGDGFAAVAADNGRDADSIDLGTFTEDEMLPELAAPVFALDDGGFTEPIKSPLGGWLIFRVTKVEPGETKSFEEARAELEAMVALDRAHDAMYDVANELDDLLVAGDTLEQAAATLGLDVKTIDRIDASGNPADPMSFQIVPSEPEFLEEMFLAEPMIATPVVETDAGGLLSLEVTAIEDSRMRDLDEVRERVIADWQASQLSNAASKTAQAIADSADADTALAALDELTGYSASGTETLSRVDTPQTAGTDFSLVAAIFDADGGDTVVVPSSDGTAQVLARVTAVDTPDPAQNADGVNAMTASVASGNRQAITAQHLAYLRQDYDIVINQELLTQRF